MKHRVPIIVVGTALVVALLVVGLRSARRVSQSLKGGGAVDASPPGATIRFVKNPELAPDFALADLDGRPISLSQFRGKVVLLNFWATWCPPCRDEIPDLIELQSKFAGRFEIIGLSMDEGSPENVKRFVQRWKINYPVAIATSELEDRFGGVAGLPTSFVLDREGRIVQKHVGLRDPRLYDSEVRALLGMPVNAKVETFEDMGQVFLRNAKRATELPGVDFSKLSAEQKTEALKRLNSENCTCGCKLTLAQCRINDTSCEVSLKRAKQVVDDIRGARPPGS